MLENAKLIRNRANREISKSIRLEAENNCKHKIGDRIIEESTGKMIKINDINIIVDIENISYKIEYTGILYKKDGKISKNKQRYTIVINPNDEY